MAFREQCGTKVRTSTHARSDGEEDASDVSRISATLCNSYEAQKKTIPLRGRFLEGTFRPTYAAIVWATGTDTATGGNPFALCAAGDITARAI